MYRVLFTLPIGDGLPVFGYGLFLMLGFIAGLLIAWRRARAAGLSGDAAIDIGLISILAGVVGARLAYLLVDFRPPDGGYGSWRDWVAVWEGGLTFQGGLFLALPAAFIYLRLKGISPGRMFDAYAPAVAAAIGFGRIGCLLNGCCWGRIAPEGSALAMYFPEETEAMAGQYWLFDADPARWAELTAALGYPEDVTPILPVYATQIASALGLFVIALILLWMERKFRDRPPGQVIVWFILLYGAGRFIIEFWRDDTPLRYGFWGFSGLRLGQWLALLMLAGGIALQAALSRGRRKRAGGTEGANG